MLMVPAEEFPFLNGKELDIIMPGVRSRLGSIDDEYGSSVVFEDGSSCKLRKVKLGEDETEKTEATSLASVEVRAVDAWTLER